MILPCPRENQNIIKIDKTKDIKILPQYSLDEALEDGRSISQPKRHYLILKQTPRGLESCQPFITFSYSKQVKSFLEINLSKILASCYLIEEPANHV